MQRADDDFIYLIVVASLALTFVAILFTLVVLRYSRLKSRRQEELLKASYVAQEAERNRIAEDMHDDIGPRLSALKFSVEALDSDIKAAERNQIAAETSESLNYVITQIRNIVRNLSSKYIAEKGINRQLHEMKRMFEQNGNITVDLDIDELKSSDYLNKDFEVNLFRVLQELTNNSIKYAHCSRIRIAASKTGRQLKVTYNDNGNGFDPSKVNKGLGLNNIDARIKLYKGNYNLTTAPGMGVKYEVFFDAILLPESNR